MNLFPTLRSNSFWILDKLKGGIINNHFQEIKYVLETESFIKSYSEGKLKKLLKHAIESTPFYKNYENFNSIHNFPVIDKTIIRENFESFRSDQFKEKELIKLTTSGSTGTPFQVFQDKNKKARNTADTLYFAEKTGYQLGQKLYYLKIWSDANRKNPLQSFFQNIEMVDVILLDDETISGFLEKLKKERHPFGIIGYASAIEQVCQYLKRNSFKEIKSQLVSAIAISETLNQFTKDTFAECFGISLVSRYSNVENGILAQQCNHSSNEFHINVASYLIEIFDLEKDIPVPEGQIGRIVLTDYFNYGMPLIRYDTGDIGSIALESNCEFKTPVLNRLEGRQLDLLYNTKGELVSSLLVYKNMWKYTEIKQYQLIQKGVKDYTLRLSLDQPFERSIEITKEFNNYLGEDANIHFEYVNEIPLLESGKRRKVINEYYK